MMKKLLVLIACVATLGLMYSCQPEMQKQHDTKAGGETAMKNLDAEWAKDAGTKDVDKTVSYYAADAIVLPENGPAVSSKDAIRNVWKGMLTAPGFSGGWTGTKVEVARSGDIGYVTGTYSMTMNDASGKPATDKGKFVEVWKKQSDGSWKGAGDISNTDAPLPAPQEKKARGIFLSSIQKGMPQSSLRISAATTD